MTRVSEGQLWSGRHRAAFLVQMMAACLLVAASAVAAAHQSGQREPSGFTIVETGRAPDGKTLYSLEAFGASVHDLLTALLRRTGSEFTVASDVTGQVSLIRRSATLEELLGLLQATARPGFTIQRGPTITVTGTGATPTASVPGVGGIRHVNPMAGPSIVPLQPLSPLARLVTLTIDEKRPVPLSQALGAISRQTGAVFRLDNRIPRDLGFAAQLTNTPLQVVLDSLAHSGALKWSIQPDGSVLIAPTDWLKLTLEQNVIAGASSRLCERCGRGFVPGWAYCPFCGRQAPGRPARQTKPQ